MSMLEELHFFLGLEVKQLPKGIFIGQSKYISDMFKKVNFHEMTISPTPMSINISLHADLDGQSFDQTLYRSLIGSLMYLTASRPDIMFAVCLCARFQANPRYSHYKAVMRILSYLKGTPNLGLWYPFGTGFNLTAFTDADHGGDQVNRKITSGGLQFLGHKLVSRSSRKQNCISLSTAESEYIAAASCCSQVLWMQSQLLDYGVRFHKIPIYCNSQSAIAISIILFTTLETNTLTFAITLLKSC
ncbi:secreted RxLR effector protein 161-like [Rutidosis leptorrhynchoides]|uniref:secreted RxLR effector protein 161-like n=1 Tax=Rutidosis leptorrhynchoides TaxID=125765 RepID=UPI003A98D541